MAQTEAPNNNEQVFDPTDLDIDEAELLEGGDNKIEESIDSFISEDVRERRKQRLEDDIASKSNPFELSVEQLKAEQDEAKNKILKEAKPYAIKSWWDRAWKPKPETVDTPYEKNLYDAYMRDVLTTEGKMPEDKLTPYIDLLLSGTTNPNVYNSEWYKRLQNLRN